MNDWIKKNLGKTIKIIDDAELLKPRYTETKIQKYMRELGNIDDKRHRITPKPLPMPEELKKERDNPEQTGGHVVWKIVGKHIPHPI